MARARFLFGPVPSRRFGLSLGVDLLPHKTCTFNCLFCQLGSEVRTTAERREYVPVADVIRELVQWQAEGGRADCITLSGSGEPTLHSQFGDVLLAARERLGQPSVLLTNSSLLHLPEVRMAACEADTVKVSLSAWDEESFRLVNRPDSALAYRTVYDGLLQFAAERTRALWVEVFIVAGVNSGEGQVARIAEQVAQLRPDRIHLNTAVRPPAERSVSPVSQDRLLALASLFDPTAEPIAASSAVCTAESSANVERILAMLRRRPCTAGDISSAFGLHANEVAKHLGKLVTEGKVVMQTGEGLVHYVVDR